jgi:hypothetical protein
MERPICKTCNKNFCAANYYRNGVRHYRSRCEDCIRKGKKLLPKQPKWKLSGYNKKPACDMCGFHKVYDSQLVVVHTDGNLNNVELSNLRSICLNCFEVVKRKETIWKRGDLEVD